MECRRNNHIKLIFDPHTYNVSYDPCASSFLSIGIELYKPFGYCFDFPTNIINLQAMRPNQTQGLCQPN